MRQRHRGGATTGPAKVVHGRQGEGVASGLPGTACHQVHQVQCHLAAQQASPQHVAPKQLGVRRTQGPREVGAGGVVVRVGAVAVAPHQVPIQQTVVLQRPNPQRHRGGVLAQPQRAYHLAEIRQAVPVLRAQQPPAALRPGGTARHPQPQWRAHVEAPVVAPVQDEARRHLREDLERASLCSRSQRQPRQLQPSPGVHPLVHGNGSPAIPGPRLSLLHGPRIALSQQKHHEKRARHGFLQAMERARRRVDVRPSPWPYATPRGGCRRPPAGPRPSSPG